MSLLEEMMDDPKEQLNERPYSRTQQAIDTAKSKVKGIFGSGQVEQGAKETGQMANNLWKDFKRFIGRKYGSHPDSVPYSDVAAFFKGNNLSTELLGTNQRRSFSPKDVGDALLKAAQQMNTDYSDEDYKEDEPHRDDSTQNNDSQQNQGDGQSKGTSDNIPSRLASLSAEDREKLLRLIS